MYFNFWSLFSGTIEKEHLKMGLFPRNHFSIKSLQNVFYITQKKERERTVLLGGGAIK